MQEEHKNTITQKTRFSCLLRCQAWKQSEPILEGKR